MGLRYNKENMEFDTENLEQYPAIPQNNIIYMLFRGIVFTPESI